MAHAKAKLDHDVSRLSICILCLCKGSQALSSGLAEFIEKNIYQDYSKFKNYLPGSICGTCRAVVAKIKKGCFEFKPKNYKELVKEQLNLPSSTRQSAGSNCCCSYCSVMQANIVRVRTLNASKQATTSKSAASASSATSSASATSAKPPRRVCQTCYSDVHPGVPHVCSRVGTVDTLSKKLTPVTKQMLASSIIREQQQEQQSEAIQLRTRGRPLTVSTGAISKAQTVPKLSITTFKQMQTEANLSNSEVKNLSKVVRQNHDRRSVEAGLAESLSHDVENMRPFFKMGWESFTKKEKTPTGLVSSKCMMPIVACSSVQNLVQ